MDSKLLRQEWVVVAAGMVVLAAAQPLDAYLHPEAHEAKHSPVSILAGILLLVLHAMWISMDRARRGREVGPWRFLTILFAPLTIVLYLLAEYRLRGVLYVLYYVGLIAVAGLAGAGATLLVWRLQGVT